MTLAKMQNAQKLTADSRRFTQIRIRRFHRRDAEYAEQIPFAQSGDDDWAKAYSSNLSNVFVCRRLPTNKNLILCALCPSTSSGSRAQSRDASAVIFLKGFLSVSIYGVTPLRAWLSPRLIRLSPRLIRPLAEACAKIFVEVFLLNIPSVRI